MQDKLIDLGLVRRFLQSDHGKFGGATGINLLANVDVAMQSIMLYHNSEHVPASFLRDPHPNTESAFEQFTSLFYMLHPVHIQNVITLSCMADTAISNSISAPLEKKKIQLLYSLVYAFINPEDTTHGDLSGKRQHELLTHMFNELDIGPVLSPNDVLDQFEEHFSLLSPELKQKKIRLSRMPPLDYVPFTNRALLENIKNLTNSNLSTVLTYCHDDEPAPRHQEAINTNIKSEYCLSYSRRKKLGPIGDDLLIYDKEIHALLGGRCKLNELDTEYFDPEKGLRTAPLRKLLQAVYPVIRTARAENKNYKQQIDDVLNQIGRDKAQERGVR